MRHSEKAICTLLALLLTCFTALSQTVTLYDAEQLSSNLVTSMCQDKLGYIWVGTEYGLNKFDGVHFTQYYNDDTDPRSLADDIVRNVTTDREGNVWVITNLGVQRYDRRSDSFDSVDFGENRTANVNDILQTGDGKIWLLHAQEGVFEVNDAMKAVPLEWIGKGILRYAQNDKNAQNDRDVLNDRNVQNDNMYLDGRGRLWIAFRDEGLQMTDTNSGQTLYFNGKEFGGLPVVDINEDPESGLVTVATNSALLQFDESSQTFHPAISFPPHHIVYKIVRDPGIGKLLLGTYGNGLLYADFENSTVKPVPTPPVEDVDITSVKAYACMKDRNGNYWLGCYQKGVVAFSVREDSFRFMPLDHMQANNGNVLRTIFADREGKIYICQEKGGITQIDSSGASLKHWMGNYTVNTMFQDRDGGFWAGTYSDGLFRLDLASGREKWVPFTGRERISSLAQDSEGNLYVAVFGDGLRSLTPDGSAERPLAGGSLGLINPYLNVLFTDKENHIWIGHYYGIDVYDPASDSLLGIPVPEALRPAIVYQIEQSPKDGSVWVGSNKGFFQYQTQGTEKGRWKRYTTNEGLPNNIICGFAMMDDGTIWAGTYRGLAKIEADGSIARYYRGDGLQDWSYLRRVSAVTSGGMVILGNQEGFTYFTPTTVKKAEFNEGITLTAIRLGEKSVNTASLSGDRTIITEPAETAKEITVSYADNTFSLRFSPMDFRDPKNVHYEFRFTDATDNKWHLTESGRSEIFFSHLSVGRHTLVVRAYDHGVYSPEKRLILRVMPPWYRTWGAYAFYVIILLGIALLWWRNYWNRRQAEANEDKIKFFVDISHELRSPLTLIKSPLNKLLGSSHDPVTTRALRNIERNTNRLLTLTNQILSIRKIEKGLMTLHFAQTPLSDFAADICHDYDYQAEKRQIKLEFKSEAPDIKVWIDRDNFDKVITNLVNNAIKYTGDGGEITVTVRQPDQGHAELVVSDNGPGIDEAQLIKIFDRFYQSGARPAAGQFSYGIGLNLTQKIVALHYGTVTARNRSGGKGAEFIVRLPLGNSHLPEDQLVEESYFTGVNTLERTLPVMDADQKTRRVRKKTTYHVAIVDDDDELRSFLETELGESYHIHSYPNGQKALEGIVDNVPDLVVSDIVMPVMDGIELLKRLKASTDTSHIPVILLTTRTDHASRVKGLQEGADAYVDKPFNLEELEVRIAGLIANRIRTKGKISGVQEQQDAVRKVELKGNDATLMEKIMKAINERMDDSDFNVEALADDVGLSRVQLHRRVKDLTGITVGEFIRNIRLQQAARLLEKGDITVAQVTYAVGFANPTHFSAAFKRHFGVTPSDYLAKHRNKDE